MKKVVLLPLDERPCNALFPPKLFGTDSMRIVTPDHLGDKKIAADTNALADFLRKETKDAYGLVLSMDMLIYGGLIPSRLHHETPETLLERVRVIRELKDSNPALVIYAFQCVMRCPTYSSDDEEPDYYAECGAEIHRLGVVRHLCEEMPTDELLAERDALEAKIPKTYLDDYLTRRTVNLTADHATLKLLKDGIIDFLVFPQDDSAPKGLTAKDQAVIRKRIRELGLMSTAVIYPGADELGMTLLTRMYNHMMDRCPGVYIRYASNKAPYLIPSYEDRPLEMTLWNHLNAAGCRMVSSAAEADLVFAVTAPADKMEEADCQPGNSFNYDVQRSLVPFIAELRHLIEAGKPVAVCDNAYCNGGDLELLALLEIEGLVMKVAGYAGWNTSSNTAGTALAQGVLRLYHAPDARSRDFLALRYTEDIGYGAVVRKYVTNHKLPDDMSYFDVHEKNGLAAELVLDGLKDFVRTYMPREAAHFDIRRVTLPWRRMFELDIDISYID